MKGRKTWAHHSSSEWCQVDTSAKWTQGGCRGRGDYIYMYMYMDILSGHKVDVGGGGLYSTGGGLDTLSLKAHFVLPKLSSLALTDTWSTT